MPQLLLLISFFIPVLPAHSEEVQCPTREVLASELLDLELSGRRYLPFEGSCVHRLHSQWIRTYHQTVDDSLYEPPTHPVAVTDKKDVAITGIKKDAYPDRWVVSFSVRSQSGSTADSFTMEIFDGKMVTRTGCAAIVTPPRAFWVYSRCLK